MINMEFNKNKANPNPNRNHNRKFSTSLTLGRSNLDSDFDEDVYMHSLPMFQKETTITEMEVYLDEPIKGLPYYRGLIHYMHCMQAADSLIIWLDTPGGQLDSALAIIDAMETTEGQVQVIVTGEAASAGSLIALSAPNLVLGAKARFMLHAASYSIGHSKQGDIESRVENSKQLLKGVVEEGYKDFLLPEEIELMFIGKDYYMDAAEVTARLEQREKLQEERQVKELQEQENLEEAWRELKLKEPAKPTKPKRTRKSPSDSSTS